MTTVAIDTTPPLLRECGRALLTGNELVVKGALEAGVSLITGYPGSPVADVFTICEQIAARLTELGIEAILANNEAQSAAMLNGARQVPGALPLIVFKSVGAYVALDGLAISNSALPAEGAGAVVVVGDDPGLTSTQVGADSRITLSGARIPILEPANAQEIKDFVRIAAELSVESGLVVGVLLTTTQADGAGTVELGADRSPETGTKRRVTINTRAVRAATTVSLPPNVAPLERDLLEHRIPRLVRAAARRGLSHHEPGDLDAVGIVTAGASYALVRDALHALGLDGRVPILRLGLTWPIDPDPVLRLAGAVSNVLVVEERSGHLEAQVRDALAGTGTPIWGKRFPDRRGIPEAAGLDPDIVRSRLGTLVRSQPAWFTPDAVAHAEALQRAAEERIRRDFAVTARTPTYCAGCPHRGTNSPMIDIRARFADAAYMRRVHGREPVDVIAHGGIGCYSMAFLPPFDEMHNLSAMGLGGATGAGAAVHVTNKHYVLVGDGTFFHGEISTIANAVKQRQDILFIILDNKTTAMTGHQGTPARDTDLMGRPQNALSIERIVTAMGPEFVTRANPDDRDAYLDLLERALLMDGTRVVIADKECAITSGRRARAERRAEVRAAGFVKEERHINIVEEACENCRACTTSTGCPGLTIVDTPLGEKIGIDRQVCVDDAYCARIKACPSFEEVTIRRSAAPPRKAQVAAAALPAPLVPDDRSRPFAIVLAGVGGMGLGVIGRILGDAGGVSWPAVDAYHKKGMAQRGGGVFSHIVLHDGARPVVGVIGDGGADLILGLDGLEAARALAHADVSRTNVVLDSGVMPTTTMLMGHEPVPDDIVARAMERARPGGVVATDFRAACAATLGDALQANIALLGAAWQRGWLPLPEDAILAAIGSGSGATLGVAAFQLGRSLGAAPPPVAEPDDIATERERELSFTRGRRQRARTEAAFAAAATIGLDDAAERALSARLPEIVVWGGGAYAARYLAAVRAVHDAAPALAAAAVHNLHRVMAIKDEVFVAHLLTSPKKYARDAERFGIDRTRGDRISYAHFNRPAIPLFGREFTFDVRARDWLLAIARRARAVRRLPAWHRPEVAFREWYLGEVIPAVAEGRLDGDGAAEALRLPEGVRGYRELRRPAEAACMAAFTELLAASPSSTTIHTSAPTT